MTNPKINLFALAGALTLGVSVGAYAQGESGALLDALVRKKILSTQEAEDIRADLLQENADTSAGKIKLGGSVKEISIYGDLRLRYQYDNRKTVMQPPVSDSGSLFSGNGNQRSRERFRLRLGADIKLTDSIFAGVQFQTSPNADSANQTFSGGFANYNIYISRAFAGWNPFDGVTLIAGKQANPFYTTDLVWDGDINPEGVVERLEFHKIFAGRSVEESTGYSKEGTPVSSSVSSVKTLPPWELTLVAGQFFFQDNVEDNFGNDGNDVWLFSTQLIGAYKFTPDVKFTVAPGFMTYTAGALTGMQNETPFNNTAIATEAASKNLAIITAPGDIAFKIAGLKTKIYWDFAYNTKGGDRARENYGMNGDLVEVRDANGDVVGYNGGAGHSSRDDIAWLAGVQLGENKRKGDWSINANYRQTGLTSVDPNLNDSDFAFGQLNTQGFKVAAAYSLTDSCVVGATYFDAQSLRGNLFGGQATKDNKLAYLDSVRIFQLDLNVKF